MGAAGRSTFLLVISEILCLGALALSILTLLPGISPSVLPDWPIITTDISSLQTPAFSNVQAVAFRPSADWYSIHLLAYCHGYYDSGTRTKLPDSTVCVSQSLGHSFSFDNVFDRSDGIILLGDWGYLNLTRLPVVACLIAGIVFLGIAALLLLANIFAVPFSRRHGTSRYAVLVSLVALSIASILLIASAALLAVYVNKWDGTTNIGPYPVEAWTGTKESAARWAGVAAVCIAIAPCSMAFAGVWKLGRREGEAVRVESE